MFLQLPNGHERNIKRRALVRRGRICSATCSLLLSWKPVKGRRSCRKLYSQHAFAPALMIYTVPKCVCDVTSSSSPDVLCAAPPSAPPRSGGRDPHGKRCACEAR